jgi:DNA-binding beta-propeller fold protein YncE
MKTRFVALFLAALVLGISSLVRASTPTENLGIRALPAPGKVAIDGKVDDWDLSGGIFACDNTEQMRERYAIWFHLMYDADNLYLLAHFIDETPMNNPGQTAGDYGFAGDSVQVRFFFGATKGLDEGEAPNSRVSHWTCWRGRDGDDIMDVAYGQKFNQGSIKDAKKQGAQQAFVKDADGKGYIHEMAIPWKLVTKDGVALKGGDKFVVTFEPNFTVGGKSRLSVKDNFKAGITLDRVFTFQGPRCWGWATCEAKGNVAPQPVRLSDGREFPVKLDAGKLVVDWNGLIKVKELQGFKNIKFNMPSDGYVSLNISKPDGEVVCQLLRAQFFSKGDHEVKWDGLKTPSWTKPGEPVDVGDYSWNALYHTGVGLRLKGWACNSGSAPWDGATGKENWGGDHGLPVACAADGDTVFLGWNGAEAGQALLAVDLQGNVKWHNKRQGMCGAELIAVDNGIVYAVNWGANGSNYIYRVTTKDGAYSVFEGTDSPDLLPRNLWPDPKGKPDRLDGLEAKNKKLYLSFTKENTIMVVDGATGKLIKTLNVNAPGDLRAVSDSLLYCVSGHKEVLAIDPSTGASKSFLSGLADAHGITTDKDGNVYVGLREPENQVKVFSVDGKPLSAIGRAGGRTKIGPWTPDGMLYSSELAVDSQGKLWVMETDTAPKRVSVWDAKSGAFVKEFFGPTSYGALGGAINPLDPNLMVGQGCEWRIDPKTGKSTCLGTLTREGMENARIGVGSNGKVYVATATRWAFDLGHVNIHERIADGDYKLRGTFFFTDASNKEIAAPPHGKTGNAGRTAHWCDENGDGLRQDNEIQYMEGISRFSGWYMYMTPDLTFYSENKQFKVTGFSACGAPKYDFSKPVKMPASGHGSADGKLVLHGGEYGKDHTEMSCYDIASGKHLWSFPDNFNGVHGSHNAPPDEVGLIRGSFGPCGSATLPEPIGNIWIIPTNVGEWHMMNERGFYLTGLFQPDPMKFVWPDAAVPNAILDNCPCGMGGEDFGGSMTYARDGKLYVQAGKTGFWNVEVVGLDTIKEIKGDKLSISESDVKQARAFREQYLQKTAAGKKMTVAKATPTFSGNLDKDFAGAEIISFHKTEDAGVRASATWDAQNLYLAWEVKDATPWANGADAAEEMYLRGDTVDFQLGIDPKADKNRGEAVLGDLRLSIGNLKGTPAAVIYRKVAKEKNPKTFSSGVVKEYVMESVQLVAGAKIQVAKNPKGYLVEATIPQGVLDLKAESAGTLRGDFGVTHGDQAGQRTRLRSYWSNQHTGIVDDAVFELQMEPKNWGELMFGN